MGKSSPSHTYSFHKTTPEENRESGKLQRKKKKKDKKIEKETISVLYIVNGLSTEEKIIIWIN